MEENVKTTIKTPEVLIDQYKGLANSTKIFFNDSMKIAMEFFFKE